MYTLLPFQFAPYRGKFLLTNFVGDHCLISEDDFSRLLAGQLSDTDTTFLDLQGKNIISSGDPQADIELLATRYRTKKAYLNDFTTLHMVVTTLRCNQQCRYCHATAKEESASQKIYDMTVETAHKTVDLILQSPAPIIKIEFQGGDSSLNMPVVNEIVRYTKARNVPLGKDIEFVICTNLLHVTSEELDYYRRQHFILSVSLDGPKWLHDLNRVDCASHGTYDRVTANIRLAREYVGYDRVNALMTATKASIDHFPEIVDEYVRQGFKGIVFRSLNPYGRCIENATEQTYPIENFITSFKEGLRHIIDINKRGTYFIEGYTQLLLSRMLTPYATGFVDLQSPAGAGISGAIYDYDGGVYACDEGRMLAEMGDERLRLGSVDEPYLQIFNGEKLRTIIGESIVETTPMCTSCAYRMWCGADPARHYATQHDLMGHKAKSDFCKKHKAIFEFLLDLLTSDDESTKDVLYSWIGGRLPRIGGEA